MTKHTPPTPPFTPFRRERRNGRAPRPSQSNQYAANPPNRDTEPYSLVNAFGIAFAARSNINNGTARVGVGMGSGVPAPARYRMESRVPLPPRSRAGSSRLEQNSREVSDQSWRMNLSNVIQEALRIADEAEDLFSESFEEE